MDWSLTYVGGGKIPSLRNSSSVPGVYSEDGRYFIALFTHQLRVYFISTRQCTRTVDIDVSGATDIKLDETNGNNVLVYKKNSIVSINWKEKVVNPIINTEVVESDIQTAIKQYPDGGLLFISFDVKTREFGLMYKTGEGAILKVYETTNVVNFSKSSNNEYLAILNDNKEVINLNIARFLTNPPIADVEGLEVTIKNFTYKSAIISIAVNDDNVIALGSISGPIQIIFNDDNDNEKLLKWHIGPVKALVFDRNFLISGGEEKVLVIWQIDNDKTQFLPRLNGTIEAISVDTNKPDHYNVLLAIEGFYEVLCISAVDLVSRLSINTIRPNLKNNLSFKNSYSLIEVNPKTSQLFLPNKATIQVFDLIKNEQAYHQTVSSVLPMGKVRSETKLTDPTVTQLKFNGDGEWMCTFDIIKNNEVEGLLSNRERNYALKFWKAPANSGGWELVTKVINPHLLSPVLAVKQFQNGFVTADSKGSVRLWKNKAKSWVLVKTVDLMKSDSKSVTLTSSEDDSVLVLSHDNVVFILNQNLQLVKTLTLVETGIKAMKLIDEDLIILSQNKIVSFNLITFKCNSLFGKVNVPAHGSSYLAVNGSLIALALNIENLNKCKLLIFHKDKPQPLYTNIHQGYVNHVMSYNDSFLVVDNELRTGIISSTELKLNNDVEIKSQTPKVNVGSVTDTEIENLSFKKFDLNSFGGVFETDNLETLFDNIIKIVK